MKGKFFFFFFGVALLLVCLFLLFFVGEARAQSVDQLNSNILRLSQVDDVADLTLDQTDTTRDGHVELMIDGTDVIHDNILDNVAADVLLDRIDGISIDGNDLLTLTNVHLADVQVQDLVADMEIPVSDRLLGDYIQADQLLAADALGLEDAADVSVTTLDKVDIGADPLVSNLTARQLRRDTLDLGSYDYLDATLGLTL